MSAQPSDRSRETSAGPMRRLGAMFYDSLLIIANLVVSTFFFVPLSGDKVLVPSEVGALAYVYWIWELAVVFLYLAFFWRSKQRTLGMQAWHLEIEREDGRRPSWRDAGARFAAAWIPWLPALVVMTVGEQRANRELLYAGFAMLSLGVLNYIAGYWTSDGRPWHERWLATRIVLRK